jgi:hypothetical protein
LNVEQTDIRYEKKIVAFLDVLGFRSMISCSSDEAENLIALLDRNLSKVEGEVREHKYWGRSFSAKLFSDCICLVADYSPEGAAIILDSAAYLSLFFTFEGIFLRGGVSEGHHFENSRMIFSEGLVRAYELESKHARWPRTLVSSDVVKLSQKHVPFLVRRDNDNLVFVDYLEWCSEQISPPGQHSYDHHRDRIISNLNSYRSTPEVLEKYQWSARYHNTKLKEILHRDGGNNVVRNSMFIPGF